MRTLPNSPITAVLRVEAAGPATTVEATFSPPAAMHRSPWHSPVPYLFGGLAAMLVLIAFALLVLACSYWRHNGAGDNSGNRNGDGDAEKGESGGQLKAAPVFEEKFLVIMAGDAKPTFLATPISKNSSFNEESSESKDESSQNNKSKDETNEE